jgi:hypothetical protein
MIQSFALALLVLIIAVCLAGWGRLLYQAWPVLSRRERYLIRVFHVIVVGLIIAGLLVALGLLPPLKDFYPK